MLLYCRSNCIKTNIYFNFASKFKIRSIAHYYNINLFTKQNILNNSL